MMNMDNHCKNVCLIGIFHTVGYIIFSVDPLLDGIVKINSYDNDFQNLSLRNTDENWTREEAFIDFAKAGGFILKAILALLMVGGVFKQRHLLMAPFFVTSTFGLSLLTFLFFMRLKFEYPSYYFYQDCLYPIGVQIMILYPVYTLFLKLRYKSLKEKTLEVKSFNREIKAEHILT